MPLKLGHALHAAQEAIGIPPHIPPAGGAVHCRSRLRVAAPQRPSPSKLHTEACIQTAHTAARNRHDADQ